MVFSIVKQSVEIKTRFEKAPLTAPTEAHVAIGMLSRVMRLPMPERKKTTDEMKQEILSKTEGVSEIEKVAFKLRELLAGYRRDDEVTDELYELTEYGYQNQ